MICPYRLFVKVLFMQLWIPYKWPICYFTLSLPQTLNIASHSHAYTDGGAAMQGAGLTHLVALLRQSGQVCLYMKGLQWDTVWQCFLGNVGFGSQRPLKYKTLHQDLWVTWELLGEVKVWSSVDPGSWHKLLRLNLWAAGLEIFVQMWGDMT